jgi:glycosyltransferase involved in cell wall biosynthesis
MPGSPTTPLLSLCLATYNRARYLDRYLTHHLTSLDAAGVDYELVVSDNCSTDETPDILARTAPAYVIGGWAAFWLIERIFAV